MVGESFLAWLILGCINVRREVAEYKDLFHLLTVAGHILPVPLQRWWVITLNISASGKATGPVDSLVLTLDADTKSCEENCTKIALHKQEANSTHQLWAFEELISMLWYVASVSRLL